MKTRLLRKMRKSVSLYKDKKTGKFIVYKYYGYKHSDFPITPYEYVYGTIIFAINKCHEIMIENDTYQRLKKNKRRERIL